MPIKINGTNTAANPSITGSDTDTGIVYGSDQIDFSTGGSSKVTLNGSNLGIGTSSPSSFNAHGRNLVVGGGVANTGITIASSSATGLGKLFFAREDPATGSNNRKGLIAYEHQNEAMTFHTGVDERVRIDSSGNLLVGTTTDNVNSSTFGISLEANGSGHFFRNVDGGFSALRAGGNQGLAIIRGDGDLLNTNNSYGQASDVTLKQDIVDAASQWDDIKALRVRKFRFKDNPTGVLQIGVIAQEIETVSAGLVQENEEGIKSVKYSVLYMKAVKCLQEAIAKIEVLETKVAALEAV